MDRTVPTRDNVGPTWDQAQQSRGNAYVGKNYLFTTLILTSVRRQIDKTWHGWRTTRTSSPSLSPPALLQSARQRRMDGFCRYLEGTLFWPHSSPWCAHSGCTSRCTAAEYGGLGSRGKNILATTCGYGVVRRIFAPPPPSCRALQRGGPVTGYFPSEPKYRATWHLEESPRYPIDISGPSRPSPLRDGKGGMTRRALGGNANGKNVGSH